ncbi:hypothetical protein [Glycomyces tarimensis]
METIARHLHCDTAMLIGGGTERPIEAARTALATGLDVHLRPDAADRPRRELLDRLDAVAGAAEAPRREHHDPSLDLDKAGFGGVAVTDGGGHQRREAFGEVARRCRESA